MSKSSVFQSVSTTESDLPDLLADIESSEANAAASATSAAASAASVGSAASTATQEAANAASSATAAANSATAAANSETAAGNSETAASNFATTASGHANTASAAATTASGHANDAFSHKTDAEAAETNALASQTAAAASATAAGNSETAAGNSETNAGNSETNAGNSATAAANSATAAGNSATAAGNSETAAGNSETNAANSATAAGNSATAAGNSATAAGNSATAAANSATDASNHATTAQGHKNSALAAQTAAESARDSALSAYDNFDDRYLGVKASDPSTDNDGDALVAGTLYFNSTDSSMKLYTGSSWVDSYVSGSSFAALSGATFTGDVTVNTDLTVDSGTLFVDSSHNRVGINLGSGVNPTVPLNVAGTVRFQSTSSAGQMLEFTNYSGYSRLYRSNGHLELQSGNTGNGILQLSNSGGFTFDGNNVWHAGNLDSILDLGITDGTNGQALKTDGSGNLSFGDVATSTAWADITGKPTTISGFGITDAFDGAYSSLTGTPTIPTNNNQLTNGAGYITSADGGNADTLDTYHASTTRNAANTIPVRDGNGYLQVGWINTTSGQASSGTALNKFYASYDDYMRYTPAGNVLHRGNTLSYYRAYDWIEWRDSGAGLYWSNSTGAGWHIYPESTTYMRMRSGHSSYGAIRCNTNGTDRNFMYWDSSNRIGFLSTSGGWILKVDNSGNTTATGNVTAYSDIRLKTDIEPIKGALDKVSNLEGVEYTRKSTGEREIGFIAQDVKEVVPELVDVIDASTEEEDALPDLHVMKYQNTTALLVEAVKELKAEVDTLRQEISELKKEG